jgi:hypothetical protein
LGLHCQQVVTAGLAISSGIFVGPDKQKMLRIGKRAQASATAV